VPGTGPYSAALLNITGQAVKTIFITAHETTLSVAGIPPGVYTLCINGTDGAQVNRKVVVMH
jgi:hypothetical protein